MSKFEDLSLRLVAPTAPPKPPTPAPFRLVHLKGGAKHLVLSAKARGLLGDPRWVQVLASNDHIAIRAATKDDPHTRPVSKSGTVMAYELVQLHHLGPGERIVFTGLMDSGHLLAAVPRRTERAA